MFDIAINLLVSSRIVSFGGTQGLTQITQHSQEQVIKLARVSETNWYKGLIPVRKHFLFKATVEIIGAIRKNIYLGLDLQQANFFKNMLYLVSSITKIRAQIMQQLFALESWGQAKEK